MSTVKNTKIWRTIALVLTDALVIGVVYFIAAYATFDNLFNGAYWPILYYGIFWVGVTVLVYACFGVYKMVTDNFGLFESIKLMLLSFGTSLTLYILMLCLHYFPAFKNLSYINWKSFVLDAIVQAFLLISARFAKRIFLAIRARKRTKSNPVRTLVIGAGGAAKIVLDDSRSNPESKIKVVLFVDDDPNKIGNTLSGVKIVGPISSVAKFVEMYHIEEVIIAIASLSDEKLHSIFEYLRPCDIRIRRLPLLSEMDKIHEMKVMDVDYGELLGRGGVVVDREAIAATFKGKTVLITGAGGSIGRALALQIAEAHPKAILLYDFYESGLYDTQQEVRQILLRSKQDDVLLRSCVGTTSNRWMVNSVFDKYKPDFVFHSGSYKQVPLMEDNPIEAVRQNAIGTYVIAKAAADHGTGKFIYLSSNKALNPTNILAATKRFGEMCCEHFGKVSKTSFASVRFGNVLASSGSVVPLFAKQIQSGGPVTVTSKEATRYFATLSEITDLILQASVYASGSQIYDVDMGQPVKILNVAEQMIRQAGYIPYKDIDIKFTGLRHGEVDAEQPSFDKRKQTKTPNNRLYLDPNDQDFPVDEATQALKKITESDENRHEIGTKAMEIIKQLYGKAHL